MKNKKLSKIIIVSADVLLLVVSLLAKRLSDLMLENLSPCGVYETFGIKCLTCGGTRCVNALFDGRIKEAFYYNSYVVIAGIFALFVLVLLNLGFVFENEKARRLVIKLCCVKTAVVLGVITLLFMLIRNFYPMFVYWLGHG